MNVGLYLKFKPFCNELSLYWVQRKKALSSFWEILGFSYSPMNL